MCSEGDQKEALEKGEEAFGRIDFAFANAGTFGPLSNLRETSLEDWRLTFDVNLFGSVITLRECLKKMDKGGAVIFCSSFSATFNGGYYSTNLDYALPYLISKHALCGLARVGTALHKTYNVRTYGLMPAVYESEMSQAASKHYGLSLQNFSAGNPVFSCQPGKVNPIGKMVESLFSGTSKYKVGSNIVCDNNVTLHSKLFFQYLEDQEGPSFQEILSNARDEKGEPIHLTQEHVKSIKEQI